MRRDLTAQLNELSGISDGPVRRGWDLKKPLEALSPHEKAVLSAILQDAIDSIHRLQGEVRDARRGIMR